MMTAKTTDRRNAGDDEDDSSHSHELWTNRESSRTPLTEAQKRLALRYIPMAKALAKPLKRSWPMERDELDSAAMLALVQAAKSFDPSRNVKFATFARYRIWGAPRDVQRGLIAAGWRGDTENAPKIGSHDDECRGNRPRPGRRPRPAGRPGTRVHRLRRALLQQAPRKACRGLSADLHPRQEPGRSRRSPRLLQVTDLHSAPGLARVDQRVVGLSKAPRRPLQEGPLQAKVTRSPRRVPYQGDRSPGLTPYPRTESNPVFLRICDYGRNTLMLILRRKEGQWVEITHRSGDTIRLRVYNIRSRYPGQLDIAFDDDAQLRDPAAGTSGPGPLCRNRPGRGDVRGGGISSPCVDRAVPWLRT